MKATKRMKERWQSTSSAVKASICFTAAMFFQKGLQSLATPIFTRIMPTVEYEQYAVYYAWSGMLTIVATLNLSSGILNNLLVRGEHSREDIVSSLQGLASVWAVGVAVVYAGLYMLGMRISGLPEYLSFAMMLSFAVTPAYELWVVGKRFTFDYKETCMWMVVIACANLLLPLVCMLSEDKKGEVRVLVTLVINAAVGVGFWVHNFHKSKRLLVRSLWKTALAFNLPLLPHFLSLTILNQSDKIMIERLCIPGQAAIYSVAHTVASMIQLLMTAANYSLVPWTYQRLKECKYKVIACRTDQILLAVAVMICIIMLFAPEVMFIMAPEEYREAVFIIPSMTTGIYFSYLYQFFGRIELFHQKKALMTAGSVAGALINIVLNLIFISRNGYIAAAYTTLFCQLLLCLIHCMMARRIVRQYEYDYSPFNYRSIITISAFMIAAALFMPLLYENTLIRFGIIVAILLMLLIMRKKAMSYLKMLIAKN